MIFCFEISTYVRLGKIMKMTALWRGLYLYIWHPRAKEPCQAPQKSRVAQGTDVTRRPSRPLPARGPPKGRGQISTCLENFFEWESS